MIFGGSDIPLSTRVVVPLWDINCVLLFNSLSFLPTAFGFYFLFFLPYFCRSGLRDALVVSWDRFWPTLHLWWFFILFCFVLFSFCFVLQIVVLKEYRVFSLFSLKSQQLCLSIIDLWHRARKLFYSVFLSLVFIYWSFVWLSLFFCKSVAFLWRYKWFKEEEWAVITIVVVL